MERIKNRVGPWHSGFIETIFRHLDGVSNVLVVLLTAEETTASGCLGMRALDFDAPHLSVFHPFLANHRVIEQGLETKESKVHEIVKIPFLNIERFPIQQWLRNGNIPVVVDDQFPICCNANIKLNAVKMSDCMSEAL